MINKTFVPTMLVDTNVLADVLFADPVWEPWSSAQLVKHAESLAINPIIYAELCYKEPSLAHVEFILERFGLAYLELPRNGLFLAAKAFQAYKLRGGNKSSPLSDFLIGAHAQASGLSILTRDLARYPIYFPQVTLISPSQFDKRVS